MKINFSTKPRTDTDLVLIAVESSGLKKIGGAHAKFARALVDANPDYKAEAGEIIVAVVPGFKFKRLGILGLGDLKGATRLSLEIIGGKLMAELITEPVNDAFVDLSEAALKPEQVAALASGAQLRGYEFRQYHTKNKEQLLPESVTFDADAAARKAFAPMSHMADAVHWARDLVNEPSNVLYPDSFARRVAAKMKGLGVKVTILDEKHLEKQGFGAMIAVGKASEYPPRLVVMEYKGPKAAKGKKAGKPIALVGKGITFDTGGYSIKPSDGMLEMKCDMAGAAAVAGAMYALAANKAPVNVVACLAMAENMISDEGYKPSDILTSLSGQTIEVTNTDAEGRLVLCDAIWHIQQKYKPGILIDIATLTGAAMVALGQEFAGVFANDEEVYEGIRTSSRTTGDRIWRLPLDKAFDRAMDSPVADMKNSAATRYGGSSTGAAFLNRFIQPGVRWVHVDMAPVMTNSSDTALGPRGASGFGVRLLADYVLQAS